MKKTIYFENLNGLRFFAFLSVFIGHAIGFSKFKVESHIANRILNHFFMNGDLGVNFFFVLSGFLITYLLLNEKKEYQTISLKYFYLRRVLRIWPVYFLTVLIGFSIIPFLCQSINHNYLPFAFDIPKSKLAWYLGFAVNFDMIYNGFNFLMLTVLWSVSVEEQYYLIWPLINKINSKYFAIICMAALLVISYYYRWIFYADKTTIKYSTFSVMNNLTIGSIAALCSFKLTVFVKAIKAMKKWFIVLMYLTIAVCIPMRGFIYYFSEDMDRFLVSLEPFVFSLFFAFIIVEQNYAKHSFFKISKINIVDYLGTISYGLYCYHMIFIFATSIFFNFIFGKYVETSLILFISQSILAFLFTILFSHLSYKYFEARFLKLKNRYAL